MAKCCGPSCDCNIQQGVGVTIVGTGSLSNPFIVSVSDAVTSTGETVTTAPGPVAGYVKVTVAGTDMFIPFY